MIVFIMFCICILLTGTGLYWDIKTSKEEEKLIKEKLEEYSEIYRQWDSYYSRNYIEKY